MDAKILRQLHNVPISRDTSQFRAVRREFMLLHAREVYNAITSDKRLNLRVEDLVLACAERFPDLVPTSAEIAEERQRRQADKLGLEIDQAALLQAFLSVPDVGNHIMASMVRPTRRAHELIDAFKRTGNVILDSVSVVRRDGVGHITFHNLTSLNAEDLPFLRDFEAAVDLVLMDEQIRVGVLRGAYMNHPKHLGRRVFCSGLNLKELAKGRIPVVDYFIARELGLMSKLHRGILLEGKRGTYGVRVEKPWIAAVDSFAIGGGMQLLLVADWVIAATDSWFSLPAAREGFLPGLANFRLGRSVGHRLARRLILGGSTVKASGPDAGLVCDRVVPPAEMDAAIREAAASLGEEAALVNRVFLNRSDERPEELREYLADFGFTQAQRMCSPDVASKVEAFGNHDGTTIERVQQ
ncbi:3,5-dihydroxyphenylacetyl-CoA monooxygenase [Rhizobium sp. PP-F2F-G36]|nr:3,5-dihydroxyphenylacetyl-CoA monooxygenase [Rhizobium sp. PP-F2F-G36]